jgi:Predicted transcriptional regulators
LSGESRARSIGEVLEELVEDFPDVSVSKIRFLEAQGLITPGRTPSGYRQFSESDVALLRWILAQQREHYSPSR